MGKIMEKFGDNEDETLVSNSRVSCDGGVLGHPKIYLSLEFGEIAVCPRRCRSSNLHLHQIRDALCCLGNGQSKYIPK